MSGQKSNTGKARLKKYAVLAAMFAAFAGSMWLIFAPSEKDKAKAEQGKGFNTDIPEPRKAGIVGDKKEAYEREQTRRDRQERMLNLRQLYPEENRGNDPLPDGPEPATEDLTQQERGQYERQLRMAPKPVDYPQGSAGSGGGSGAGYKSTDAYARSHGTATQADAGKRSDSFEASKSAYRDINETLGSFYEQPVDAEKEELKAKVEQLEAAVAAGRESDNPLDDQIAIMEKSYEMAAKYMGGQGRTAPAIAPDKPKAEPVRQVERHIVTALTQPMSNEEFIEGFARPRNTGFNTATVQAGSVERNTIGAVVHSDQTVTDGQSVRLRLTEPLRAGILAVPANTIVTGFARVQGERLEIVVSSVEHGGRIVPVELTAYDTDGQRGVSIPGSMEINAAKEIAANAGGNLGSSISLTQRSAGQQLATDLGRGVIQGTSAYLSKKISRVKVTLKAGYRIMLLPSEN